VVFLHGFGDTGDTRFFVGAMTAPIRAAVTATQVISGGKDNR